MERRRHDVAPEEEPVDEVVEKPPYRMVPGNDRVCTGDVLSRFKKSMNMQPSGQKTRKKGKWERKDVNPYIISGILEAKSGTPRVTAAGEGDALKMSENNGHHLTRVSRINEVHVRWIGPFHEQTQRLNEWTEILRRAGYTVVVAEENNVDWPSGQSRKFLTNLRNRKFLRVAKFLHQRQNR